MRRHDAMAVAVGALVVTTFATGVTWAATPRGSGAGCGATSGLVVGMIDTADRAGCPLHFDGSLTWAGERASGSLEHSNMLFCPLSNRPSSRLGAAIGY